MERKIGDTFEFEGKKLEVKAASRACEGCFLEEKCCIDSAVLLGACGFGDRTDKKFVVFVEVKDEQPQEQAEQTRELNLCEILKDCPQGEKFWSPMLNDVKFSDIDDERQMIIVETIEGHFTWEINHDGTISIDQVTSPEIMLYPSREQRDWTKVKYESKKERFDPKTLKAFDKVLVRSEKVFNWNCSLFSNIDDSDSKYQFMCLGLNYRFCIPYNDDTKHLVGTTDEAPEFYRYWED